jgi:hypothetical protein
MQRPWGQANALPRPAKPARQSVSGVSFPETGVCPRLPPADARFPALLEFAAPALPAAARRSHPPTTGALLSGADPRRSLGSLS